MVGPRKLPLSRPTFAAVGWIAFALLLAALVAFVLFAEATPLVAEPWPLAL